MAQLIRLSVILLCCFVIVFCSERTETGDDKFSDVLHFVLNHYNERSDAQLVYNSAKIINAYRKNDTEPLYFLQLDVTVNCNGSENCDQSPLICEVGVRENPTTNTKELLTDKSKCAKKEFQPAFPSAGHGFKEENITDEIRSIAAFAIQQAESNANAKRSVIDIMSVKRQVIGNATTLYLTLKVTKPEGGDAAQFEVCEAEVNKTGEMAWESSLICFPLNGMIPETPVNAEDIRTVAERAADEMDSLSFSEFTLKLMTVLKADTAVTPGSEGIVTALELKLSPSLCLKNIDIENDGYGLYEKRQCPENTSNKHLVCSVISWDRPWVEDTLYSEPSCYEEGQKDGPRPGSRGETAEIQSDSPDSMMSDQKEPETEEYYIPAVEHHSIPVVEELDPIIEQVLPHPEASLTPVVEEPIVAKHTYCVGCPIDLDVSNPGLDEFVEQALAVIDEGSLGEYMHKATRIAKAQKQVVNGVKYILHLEVAETSCLKGSGNDRTTCELKSKEVKTCLVEFLEKPWLDSSREIISNNCTHFNNELENDIKPHFISYSPSSRQEIMDYLDALDEPRHENAEELAPSLSKDSMYLPEDPLLRNAEEVFEVKETTNTPSISETVSTQSPAESEESKESAEKGDTKKQNSSDESDKSSEESGSNEKEERKIDQIAAYITEDRNRRETANVGALKEIPESEKDFVDKLAQTAVNTLDEIDEDDRKRIVLEVISAHKQIVNGIMYHLRLRVVSTTCSESQVGSANCMENHVPPVRICKIELHRSFASTAQPDAKVVKSECTAETQALPEKTLREKRAVETVTGGISSVDTSDPYIVNMANFGVSELDMSTNSLYTQCVVRIISASKQVVAGSNVYISMEVGDSVHRKGENVTGPCQLDENGETRVCHVMIWHRPNNSQQMLSYNCSNGLRSKREVEQTPGGLTSADPSDSYIQDLANTALLEVDRRSNAIFKQQVVRIIEAKKQVVSGLKVHLKLELGYTTCRKGRNTTTDCQLSENSNNQICQVEVWDRPWLPDRQVTNVNCSPASRLSNTESRNEEENSTSRKKRHVVGGFSKVDIEDPYVQEMAKTAVTDYDMKSNAAFRQKVVRIIEAHKQVVAGTLTKLTLEMGYSKCIKGHDDDIDACEMRENSKNQVCYVEVWDRAWLHKREVTKMTCNPVNEKRLKRKMVSNDSMMGAFEDFKQNYNKKYPTAAEHKRRYYIFQANMNKISFLQKTEQGTGTYGVTKFADLTAKEFKRYHLGLNPKLKDSNDVPMPQANIPHIKLPNEFDWRHYNVVTPVKDQGSCGSCWAFSVTGNIEGQWAIKKGKLYSLSEQELVDCDNLDDGCNGGLPDNAYKAIEKLGGLETEKDYPYDAQDEKCHFDKSEVEVTISGALNISSNETEMAQWLYKNGPISIGINANAMQFYTGGVSHPWKMLCSPNSIDHGVLIVGFGVDKFPIFHEVLPYWIIKNSWGPMWGEQGYYRLYRGDGSCGVNQMVSSAIV